MQDTNAETLWIRPELSSDMAAVRAVQVAAFGRRQEADLVEALRHDRTEILSLVAGEADHIVGHIMLSKMRAPFRALGLGPVAVLPERQGNGIGSKLIRDSLDHARACGWEAAFVVGDPVFYQRFGFSADLASGFQSPYSGPYLMVVTLKAAGLPTRSGSIEYAPAFASLE